jgi:ribosomal protein S18
MQPTMFPPNPEVVMREFPDDLVPTGNLGKTTYMPLNVHPNPYMSPGHPEGGGGNQEDGGAPVPPSHPPRQNIVYSAPAPALQHAPRGPPPQHAPPPMPPHPQPPHPDESSKINESDLSIDDYVPKQAHRIPAHDISIDPMDYTHDESILPNYIPDLKKIKVRDYIKEYDETEGQRLYEHEVEKARQTWYETVFHAIKNPILVFLFFLLFQMNFVKRIMLATLGRFTGNWLFNEEGNFTTLGITVKASIFTSVFVFLNWLLVVL